MRRARPRQHIRKLKRGRRIVVNRGIRPTINKKMRKMFTQVSNPRVHKNEFGGTMDFKKDGTMEFAIINAGGENYIDNPADAEVEWHTHPTTWLNPPSEADIYELLHDPEQQAEVIFRDGDAFIIEKTTKTRALTKLPPATLKKVVGRALLSADQMPGNLEKNYVKVLTKMGFRVRINRNPTSPIKLNIKPKEPR